MVKGTIVFNCFRFWIYEVRGGCMGFNQHEYKVIGNYNKNKEILTDPVKIDNSKGH